MSNSKFNRIEYLIYAILLLIILLGPTLSTLFHGHEVEDVTFLKNDLWRTFKAIIAYVIALAIHDVWIAPLLVYKHKPWHYILGVVVLGTVFMVYKCNTRPADAPPPAIVLQDKSHDAAAKPAGPPALPPMQAKNGKIDRDPITPPPFRRHDIVAIIMFIFGIGTNIGIKFYFYAIGARRQMENLEKENLKQSLEQLRYQLHPHFFMNTLNNIHALVDIDPKKAQECIIDLSKLMRYVLYDSNHDYVQASREMEFMANYVSLTRIRYSDKLKFTVNTPDDGTHVWIPPLLFISFVENAFKHGVSFSQESYITIGGKIYNDDNGEPRMYWTCLNSKRTTGGNTGKKKVSEASGIGLANVRQRLDLMFGKNYSLTITDGDQEFLVEMDIPVKTSDPTLPSDDNKK